MRIYKRKKVSNRHQNSFITGTMKLMVALFAVLAVFGLSQAHQFPDFGKGPLHEHIQDFLDLVPEKEIENVIKDYWNNDPEVKKVVEYLKNTSLITYLWHDFKKIPELNNFIKYLQKEGIEVQNPINGVFNIKKLMPLETKNRTGGVAGLFKDITQLIDYDKYVRLYAEKIGTSPTFIRFIKELSSDNSQQIVNKLYKNRNFQFIRNYLKRVGVNVKVADDIMYFVLGITTPTKTLVEEFQDFLDLLPKEELFGIYLKYRSKDKKVNEALKFLTTSEFHSLQRTVENLQEFIAIVVFLEKAGVPVVDGLRSFHAQIEMKDDYVPPYMKQLLQQKGESQQVGEGMKAMLEELYNALPIEKIDNLFYDKLFTSKVFSDFVLKMSSPEVLKKFLQPLYAQKAFQQYIARTTVVGLEPFGFLKLAVTIFGIKPPR